MPIKIEKKVALWPLRHPNRKSNHRFPFAEMEVGDSFKVQCQDHKRLLKVQSAITSAYASLKPKKFTTRSKKTCLRCWRIV